MRGVEVLAGVTRLSRSTSRTGGGVLNPIHPLGFSGQCRTWRAPRSPCAVRGIPASTTGAPPATSRRRATPARAAAAPGPSRLDTRGTVAKPTPSIVCAGWLLDCAITPHFRIFNTPPPPATSPLGSCDVSLINFRYPW